MTRDPLIYHITHVTNLAGIVAAGGLWSDAVAHAEYFADQAHLDRIRWTAVEARQWSHCKEEKQAEFLVKDFFPWGKI